MKIEFRAIEAPKVDAAQLIADVKQVGAFVDKDGDLNIVTHNNEVICFMGNLGGWAFIRSHSLKGAVDEGIVKRPLRRGETLTITF